MADPVCAIDGPHLHQQNPTVIFYSGPAICIDQRVVALGLDQPTAARIVELLARHGLADVPDTCATLGEGSAGS